MPHKQKEKMTRIVLNIVNVILIALVILDLLFWGLAGASSHNVPASTSNGILISFVVLVCLIAVVNYLKRKLKRK
jgi:hypothetical protein